MGKKDTTNLLIVLAVAFVLLQSGLLSATTSIFHKVETEPPTLGPKEMFISRHNFGSFVPRVIGSANGWVLNGEHVAGNEYLFTAVHPTFGTKTRSVPRSHIVTAFNLGETELSTTDIRIKNCDIKVSKLLGLELLDSFECDYYVFGQYLGKYGDERYAGDGIISTWAGEKCESNCYVDDNNVAHCGQGDNRIICAADAKSWAPVTPGTSSPGTRYYDVEPEKAEQRCEDTCDFSLASCQTMTNGDVLCLADDSKIDSSPNRETPPEEVTTTTTTTKTTESSGTTTVEENAVENVESTGGENVDEKGEVGGEDETSVTKTSSGQTLWACKANDKRYTTYEAWEEHCPKGLNLDNLFGGIDQTTLIIIGVIGVGVILLSSRKSGGGGDYFGGPGSGF